MNGRCDIAGRRLNLSTDVNGKGFEFHRVGNVWGVMYSVKPEGAHPRALTLHLTLYTLHRPRRAYIGAGAGVAAPGALDSLRTGSIAGGISLYITGVTSRDSSVDEMRPPMMTQAIGE